MKQRAPPLGKHHEALPVIKLSVRSGSPIRTAGSQDCINLQHVRELTLASQPATHGERPVSEISSGWSSKAQLNQHRLQVNTGQEADRLQGQQSHCVR